MVKTQKPSLLRRIMKLAWPFFPGYIPTVVGSPQQPTPELETNTIVIHDEPIGSGGQWNFAGWAHEDYFQKMRGHERADIFDQMRRSDPQIAMCLAAIKNIIKSAVYTIEPYKVKGADIVETWATEDAALIEHILFEGMEHSWSDFIDEALNVVDFGHSVFEILDKPNLNHPKFGSFNGIKALSYRSPRSIYRWNLNGFTGELLSITQYAFGDLQRLVDIPEPFLLIFNIAKEGANFEGISLLRPCYGPWFRKNTYMKLNAVGIEKHAVPTPVATIPNWKPGSQEYTHLEQVLSNYCAHQSNYVIIPDGMKIDFNSNTYDPQKVEVSIDNEDKRIAKAFLVGFLELGVSSASGSWALSTDQSDFFLSSLVHIANRIPAEINKKLIPRMIKLNKGEREGYPKLCVSNIADKAGKELADLLSVLAGSKILTPDDPLEDNIRKRYNLPEKSNEGIREVIPGKPIGLAERIKLAEVRRLEGLHRGK